MRSVYVHGRAVLPDRILDDALVVVEDGLIAEVGPARPGLVPAEATDLRGALVLPGLVDTHSDGLEKEIRPRPGVEFDAGFGLASFEGRVRAAGVTTCFHGVGYEVSVRKERTIERARRIERTVLDRVGSGCALVDHRVLYRLDARDPAALGSLQESIAARQGSFDVPPLVSFEDHTPGQGQYRDATYFRRWLEGTEGLTPEAAQQRVDQLVAERDTRLWHRPIALAWLAEQAGVGALRLLAHDPVTVEEIDAAVTNNVSVAEFPTTLEAARAAKERGLFVVAGAPNVLRGGSHSGNVSALELIGEGLVDALSSDYLPTTLLAAAVRLADREMLSLPAAVGLVTSGPARTAGLTDRGALAAGLRGDLVVATVDRGWPTVRLVRSASEDLGILVAP